MFEVFVTLEDKATTHSFAAECFLHDSFSLTRFPVPDAQDSHCRVSLWGFLWTPSFFVET